MTTRLADLAWGHASGAIRGAICACAVAFLSACSAGHTGDFGRRADNIITRTALPKVGLASAWIRGEPVSLYPFTDDEIELRDRAWRFLMPSHDKAHLQMKLAELSYTRVLPPMPHSGRSHYHLLLMTEDYRSVASRYQKLGQDVEADRQLMVPFSQTAARVCAADRTRIMSLDHVKELDEVQREAAVNRVRENRGLVEWVRRDMREKAAAYRYALEHIAIEAPMREAIRAEQAVIALESAQQTLDYWDGCGENTLAVPPRRAGARDGSGGGTLKDAERRAPYAPMSPAPVQDRQGLLDGRPPK